MVLPEKTPKVSVCVITYNHEKYIRQCLQSIVDQETDFDFEVIVGDDCSTDGTRDIVREFAERYPGIVKPIYQEKNIGGGVHNFLTVHKAARGEFIAHVDGDDYCLPGKLQAQADLLDSDPGCNIVFHRMLVMMPTGEIKEGALLDVKNIGEMRFDRGAIIQYMAIGGHSSKMYRKVIRDYDLPNFDVIDYFVNVEQIANGYARFVGHENFGVYRMGGGIAASGSRSRQALAASFLYFSKKYPEYRLQVNTAALLYLIVDLKNWRRTWPMFFVVWVKTFHVASIANLLSNFNFMKQLRLTN
jgi:glycosyltransferase involved in cell wall biosynthesis